MPHAPQPSKQRRKTWRRAYAQRRYLQFSSEQEIAARREALGAALKSLDAITDDRELSDEVVKLLRARHEIRSDQLPDSLNPDAHDVTTAGTRLTRELIATERKFIHVLLRDGKITDEIRRRIERDLDLEEASLANREYRRIPL